MNKYNNKKIAVIGFGIEGKDAIRFMLGKGAEVTLFDKKEEGELDFSGVDKNNISLSLGENYLAGSLNNFDYVLRSPGVYRYMPEIIEAEENGAIITSAIKIFFEECPGKIIGVTGTKGKGTTSTLINEILKIGGKEVYLTGNIGKPSLELLPKLHKDSWIVMEMSSFQLIDMTASPHIAVILNITEDHMDWHKDREEYVNAKRNIVKFQSESDWAVINEEYKTSKSFAEDAKGQIIFFSKQKLEQKYQENLLLRGKHNLENIAAAVEASKIVGIPDDKILNAISLFKGLEHRLELVGEVDGVTFYNDSFATGPQPTIAAINSFTEDETLILGGSDKGLDYQELGNIISNKANVKNVILIGQIRSQIKMNLQGDTLRIYDLGESSMNEIVKKAFEVTPKGGVVILSPAAASFDMFKNYKDRGNQFKSALESLKS